jgi:hypothetical protein
MPVLAPPFGAHDAPHRRSPRSGRAVATATLSRIALLLALAPTLASAAPAQPPEVVVNGKPERCPAPSAHGIDYACLNAALKADTAPPLAPAPAIDATTRKADVPSKVGTFSYTATAQRMGKNFGHSASPYRPPPPVYGHAAIGARPAPARTP